MNLIIVESPTKAKTLNKFLGKDFHVEATMGHIKDLPKSKLSVDVEHNFKPDYQPVVRQEKTIKNLQKQAKKAKLIYLATDPDREGEAISAHVKEIIGNGKTKRIVFHEITKEAVEHAITEPRGVDMNLVDAQIARRVLDRLVGYKISPVLWRKVRRGLSAGRVQTVAVRLIVEKEREIEKFKAEEYWEIASEVKKKQKFIVALAKINDKKAKIDNGKDAKEVVTELKKSKHVVAEVIKREVKKNPYPPFTTSTMTQAAARMFGWTARRTMTVAQKLYEHGYITYHRTDSINLSQFALNMSREYISKNFGATYLPEKPRVYKKKSKNAQEAHEAIRVTKADETGKEIKDQGQKKLYQLIWRRFLACQMNQAVYDSTTVVVNAGPSTKKDKYELRVSGQVIKFDGWRRVMPIGKQDDEPELPEVEKGDDLDLVKVLSEQKFTQPPARFNEASLIKTLEQLGIGRPSTYAPTIQTIQLRQYVEKKDNKFFTTPVGEAVNDFLLKNFPDTFEYQFTAEMEDDLDNVANGKKKWTKIMKDFWPPLEKKVKDVEKNAERIKIETEKLGENCPDCNKENKKPSEKFGELVIRVGRFGKFISCSRFPDCKYTAKYLEKIDMECPECGTGEVIVKKTGKGRTFYGCSRYPDCDYASWKNPQKAAKEEI